MKFFKNSIKLYLLPCVFMLISYQTTAQEFTMNGKTPLIINPAFTGIKDFGRLGVTFTKFPVFENFDANIYTGFDAYIPKLKGGVGFFNKSYFVRDFYRASSYGLSYSYQGKIKDKWQYSLGTNVKFNENVYNWDNSSIICSTPCPIGKQKIYSYDVSLGGLIYSDKWFLGYALADVVFNQSFTNASKSNINFGRTFEFKKVKDLFFTTSIYMSLWHIGWTYMDFQTMVRYKNIYVGAKIGETGFALQTGANLYRFRLNYSLNNSFSKLVNTGLFTHEIALQIKLPQTINRSSNAFNHLLF